MANKATASQQIDTIIKEADGWKSPFLANLRAILQETDPEAIEKVK